MRALAIAALTLLLLALAAVLTLGSQQAVLSLAEWSVRTFTGLRLEIKQPHLALYQGRFSASEVHLLPAANNRPALATLLDLELRVTPRQVLSGQMHASLLKARQLIIYIDESEKSEDARPEQWLQFLNFTPKQLQLAQVHLISAAENVWIFPLKNVLGTGRDNGSMHITADADYDGEPINASLDILAQHSNAQISDADVSLQLSAPLSKSQLDLTGQVHSSSRNTLTYDFQAQGRYSELNEFLKGFDEAADIHGALSFQARMRGDSHSFMLSDAHLTLDNHPAYAFTAEGEMHHQRSGESAMNLTASGTGQMASLAKLAAWLPVDLSPLGEASADVILSGSLENPVVRRFVLHTDNADGLTLRIQGQSDRDKQSDDPEELTISTSGPSAGVLRPWLGTVAFDPGPWQAAAIAVLTDHGVALNRIEIKAGDPSAAALGVSGSIAHIGEEAGLAALQGVDLRISAQATDASVFSPVLPTALLADHAIKAEATLTGAGDALLLHDGHIATSGNGLQASVSGMSAQFQANNDAPVTNLHGQVRVDVSDTSVLSRYVSEEVPALGALTLSGTITQQHGSVGLQPLALSLTGKQVDLSAHGTVAEVAQMQGVVLNAEVTRADIGHALQSQLPDLHLTSSPGSVAGTFTVTDEQQTWAVKNINLHNISDDDPLQVAVAGSIADISLPVSSNLNIAVHIDDPALLLQLFHIPLKPVHASVDISPADNTTESDSVINGHITLGGTTIHSRTQVTFDGQGLSGFSSSVDSPHVSLSDLGLQASSAIEAAETPHEQQEKGGKPLNIRHLLDMVPDYPIALSLHTGEIRGAQTSLSSLDLVVAGTDRRYMLRRFSLGYADTPAEVRGVIDLTTHPPVFSLAGEALSLPMAKLDEDLGTDTDIRGTLSARGGITAHGSSSPEILASLSGNIAFALADAEIKGAAYDVLATDLLAWIYSGASQKKSTHVDCTTARFDVKQGIASSDSLYIESKHMVATGSAKIDLPGNKIKATVTPLSKSRALQIPARIGIKGKLDDPEITYSPVAAAIDTSAQALTLIPRLALKLFGLDGKHRETMRPCQAQLR